MFLSTYLPVNMHRVNCAIYSAEKVFPEERLVQAYAYITDHPVEGVVMSEGNVSFIDDPDISWTLPEIYLAYEAYSVAIQNNFSYYMVKDKAGIPQLFISKAFRGHRILVNAFTMQSVLLGNKQLVTKAASLIDRTYPTAHCLELFNVLSRIENGSAKFLPALLVNRQTSDEYMVVSPITTLMSDVTTVYGVELIDDMKALVENPDLELEEVSVVDGKFVCTAYKLWPALPRELVEYLLSTYDKLQEKKSNYIDMCDEDWNSILYFSTNYRYLVNAKTFECVVIKNQHLKESLIELAKNSTNPKEVLQMTWALANESAYEK